VSEVFYIWLIGAALMAFVFGLFASIEEGEFDRLTAAAVCAALWPIIIPMGIGGTIRQTAIGIMRTILRRIA
jgi:hypothetical protein